MPFPPGSATPPNPPGFTEATVLTSIAWVADSPSVPVEFIQLDGTDSPPILLDEASVPVIPPPPVCSPTPRAPKWRPANCGVGYQAPEPAVVPRPLNVCCP